MFPKSSLLRTVASLSLIAFMGAGLGTGCKKKPSNEPEVVDVDAWKVNADLLASYVPADVQSVLFINDFRTTFQSYQGMRDRAAAYIGDLASVEADLRNTLGFDPVRPQNLSQIGVNPEGGAYCALGASTHYCGVLLDDASVFEAHARTVLAGQPFNHRAAVQESALPGGGKLLRFSTDEGGPVQVALVVAEKIAVVIPRPSGTNLDGLAASLEGPAQTPLRDLETYRKTLEHNGRDAAWIWLSPLAAKRQLQRVTMLGDALPDMSNVEGAIVGLKLASDAFHGSFSIAINGDDPRVRAVLKPSEGTEAADFSRFVNNDAYLILRARADLKTLASTLRSAANDEAVGGAEDAIRATLGDIDVEAIEAQLTEALGSDMLIVATRARLLTLAALARGSEPNARALGDGLGLIIAYQLRDASKARALLQELVAKNAAILRYDPADERPERWTVLSGKAAGTVLSVADDVLVAATERQMSDVVSMLASTTAPELTEISAEEGRALRTKTEDIGIFIDLKRVANNAIGTIASGKLSASMKDGLQLFDEFWMRANLEDQWLTGTWRIQLSTPARQ